MLIDNADLGFFSLPVKENSLDILALLNGYNSMRGIFQILQILIRKVKCRNLCAYMKVTEKKTFLTLLFKQTRKPK